MSFADDVFIKNCQEILASGYSDEGYAVRPKWADGSLAHTKKCFCIVNRYDLSKEFPITTLRRTFFKNCIDELLWIWQKKSNVTSLLKSRVWDSWTGEDGTIGKAYGYQLGKVYDFSEGKFDQVDKILYDLSHNPLSRRIIAHMYNFADLKHMNLYPCAYSLTLNVGGGKLNAVLNQRSQDMLVANNWNVCQYAVLVHMFAQVSRLEVGELVHVIADAHIYDRHMPLVEKVISNTPYPAPAFKIDKSITDFYKFTADSFELEDYKYHELGEKIEVAV